ncbi:helix-turn-helix domain-containing protein [Cellulomonas hominis]
MVLDPETLGRRVAESRLRAGLTQHDLAAAVGLDRSALAKVEVGDRRLTALELSRIADAVGSRIEWFVTEPAPAIISHRNLLDPGAASPRIDDEVERRARAVEFVTSADGGFQLGDLPVRALPTDTTQIEELAAEARILMGLSTAGPVIGLAQCVGVLGIVPFVVDLGHESADAATVLLRTGAVSVVNGVLRVGRRRLALAHEIGHALVADDYTVDWRVDTGSAADHRESLFERFARALLLPDASVIGDWARWRGSAEEEFRAAVVRLASVYRVDMATLSRRLLELGLIDGKQAAQIRLTKTTRADIVELSLVVGEEMIVGQMPPGYESAVLRLYRREVVSEARALDLLFGAWEVDDLPVLPQRPEAAIWQYVS